MFWAFICNALPKVKRKVKAQNVKINKELLIVKLFFLNILLRANEISFDEII